MAAAEAAATAQQPVSAQVVGNAFVQQYYQILHHSPSLVHRFYQDISKLGRPEEDGSMSITTTMDAIDKKIVSLNYEDFRAEIKSVDAQESFNGAVQVLVTGYLTGKDNTVRNFAQSFFLAPQDRGYFVLNDMFRYVDNIAVKPALVNDVVIPIAAAEPIPAPVQENDVSEESSPSAEEATAGEVYNPPEIEEVPVTEEVPIAEVVAEIEEPAAPVVEPNSKSEEVPKKSYASIVMHLKESAGSFSPPPAPPRRAPQKNVDQVNSVPVSVPDGPVSSSDSVDNEHIQEGEADGYSIYVKGLPMNATETMLEEVFKEFGAIKKDGIQVRSNRQQGFCFGFVEFEEAASVEKALAASPVTIGARQAFVEEKRSTNSRGNNNRGRFQSGRGFGFRGEGGRGRGNYGGGRGYNKGDFNGRNEFGNRGGNRGGSRDGYSNGGRTNRSGGLANGSAKNTTPRVPATA